MVCWGGERGGEGKREREGGVRREWGEGKGGGERPLKLRVVFDGGHVFFFRNLCYDEVFMVMMK